MGKARIQGNNAKILVIANGVETEVGEIDKFSAKNLAELKKSQPIGDKTITSQVVHKGWELSFEGGKVDWNLAALLHSQDQQIVSGGRSPQFKVKQKITFFDSTVEEWEYPSVCIYGYEIDVPSEDLTEKFSGYTGQNRTKTAASGLPDQNSTIVAILGAMGKETVAPDIVGKIGN